MKKNNLAETPVVDTEKAEMEKLLADIRHELASSEDFILSYIKVLALVHGGGFNLDDLKSKYGWKLTKVQALSAALNHFCARGLLRRGASSKEISLK